MFTTMNVDVQSTTSTTRPSSTRWSASDTAGSNSRYDSGWGTTTGLLRKKRKQTLHSIKNRTRVRINISGSIFETFSSTLERFPETLLGDAQKRVKYYYENEDEFFFNRNRFAFESIFQYYQTYGKLIKPDGISVKDFIEELEFFKLGEEVVNYFKVQMHYREEKKVFTSTRSLGKLWTFLSQPESSKAATIFSLISQGVIILSVVCFCLESVSTFVADLRGRNFLEYVEIFVITFFTLEYVIRFIAAPRKWMFFKAPLNIIDLLAIIPFYLTTIAKILPIIHPVEGSASYLVLKTIRLFRILRIFKLARHMSIFKIIGQTISHSGADLLLLGFLLSIAIIIFSSVIYYVERDTFGSIPEAFWWCIITVTNVGYGDIVPVTPLGKVVGSLCCFAGIITLAFPIPVIVSSFMYFYNMERENKKHGNTESDGTEEGYRKKMELMKQLFGDGKQQKKFGSTSRARVSPTMPHAGGSNMSASPAHMTSSKGISDQ